MKLNVLSCSDVLQQLCKATGKWGLYIAFVPLAEGDWWGEVVQAAPYLRDAAPFFDCGWMLFDTQAEMQRHFDMTVGDDGPTETNSYSGPTKVYALTCNPQGQFENENT